MNKLKNSITVLLFLLITYVLTGCSFLHSVTTENPPLAPSSPATSTSSEEVIPSEIPLSGRSSFTIHYIDVGQADASLVLCDGKTMLIDGGNVADSSLIVAYLKKLNIDYLDYIVCTHAHEDHVGGLSGALSVARAGVVYAPQTETNSKAYNNFLRKVSEQNLRITHPTIGSCITLGNSNIQFIGPISEATSDLNNSSIVLKITYGDTSFLFTGDAEREEEQTLLGKEMLESDVLKVGHHGSDTSTSYPFLREVMPEYAVISVGKSNSYGHPTETVLSRLRDADVKVYRTDLQGDIIVRSDGENITVTATKNENIQTNETAVEYTEGIYIGNKNSKKFHKPDCRTLPAKKNCVEFTSRADAMNAGYSPCRNCMGM